MYYFMLPNGLLIKNILQSLQIDVPVELRQIFRQLDVLRADSFTVLAVAAAGDTAILHECIESFRLVELADRMQIEQICLHDRRRPHEA